MTEPALGQFLDRLAIWWLRDRYAVIPLGNELTYVTLPVPETPPGYKLVPVDAEIVPPGVRLRHVQPPALALYVPESKRVSSRQVMSIGWDAERGQVVEYVDDAGAEHVIEVSSFHRWRQRVRAVLVLRVREGA